MPESLAELGPQLANIRAFWLGFGVADRHDGGLDLYRSGIRDSELNGVLRLPPGDPAGPLREAARRLAGVPWRIWAGPDSGPGLPDALLAAGAAELEPKPVMAIALDRIVPPDLPPGVSVAEIGPDGLPDFVDCYGPSLGVPPGALRAQAEAERARLDPPGSLVRFAARVDGTMVGTAVLLDREGVGGLYAITARARFRRRGIGTALTATALAAARERGLPLATLHATPAGEPVYRRMGFTEVARYRQFSPPAAWG